MTHGLPTGTRDFEKVLVTKDGELLLYVVGNCLRFVAVMQARKSKRLRDSNLSRTNIDDASHFYSLCLMAGEISLSVPTSATHNTIEPNLT